MPALIHQELARLWRKYDPLDAHTLPPRQREVLRNPAGGRKTIAGKHGRERPHGHTYERALFERAKVTSRAELMGDGEQLVRPGVMP